MALTESFDECDPISNRNHSDDRINVNPRFVRSTRWSFGTGQPFAGQHKAQVKKVAAQASRPLDSRVRDMPVAGVEKSDLRKLLEILKVASFALSFLAIGSVVLSLLLIGASVESGLSVTLPRNLALLVVSVLFALLARRLRSRVSVYLRIRNV